MPFPALFRSLALLAAYGKGRGKLHCIHSSQESHR